MFGMMVNKQTNVISLKIKNTFKNKMLLKLIKFISSDIGIVRFKYWSKHQNKVKKPERGQGILLAKPSLCYFVTLLRTALKKGLL